MRILIASSEVVPFSKTGGLADVAGALPLALAELGHDVRVVTPKYKMVDESKFKLLPIMNEIIVRLDGTSIAGIVKKSNFPNTNIPVYFIQNDHFFNRSSLYTEAGQDYPDNILRFAFFSIASLWMLKGLDWSPDIIMCNDWQSALIPTYLKHHFEIKNDPFFKDIAVLYTIHNLAYQGSFDKLFLSKINLPWDVFNSAGLEYYDRINLMKAGIVYSEHLSTVSKQYSEEIKTPEYGCGLEGILTALEDKLTGILNGIDYSVWNPATDELLPARYSIKELKNNISDLKGKAVCKKELQKKNKLPQKPNVPLIGIISRLADQKGFDLIAGCIDDLMKEDLQIVVLGTGEPKYHQLFAELGKKYPEKMGVNITFDNALAHLIEAGSDMFLMPSKYEPCGLNQLYSLKYGTVPIVRKTGGLADSIIPVLGKKTDKNTNGTGYMFEIYSHEELYKTIKAALKDYVETPEIWARIVANGMAQDFSWNASAKIYDSLFTEMVENKKKGVIKTSDKKSPSRKN